MRKAGLYFSVDDLTTAKCRQGHRIGFDNLLLASVKMVVWGHDVLLIDCLLMKHC